MESINIFSYLFTLLLFFAIANAASTKLFREYIGAGGSGGVKFTDVPINGNVDFHFILSFAIDYTTNEKNPSPTNGKFNIFWDGKHLTPAAILSMKRQNRNVRFIVSLGGDTVANRPVNFAPKSISSWVRNAAASLSAIIKKYHLDGIDIDYEHFSSNPDVFAECIGSLIIHLKSKKIISLASIAPYEDVQSHYLQLWKKFHGVIDYVNFQFYAYDKGTSVQNFLKFFDRQTSNYKGGQILASFGTDDSGGLKPEKGFFKACEQLKRKGKLGGIFVWSADDSKKSGYKNEKLAQQLLALH